MTDFDDEIDPTIAGWKVALVWVGALALSTFALALIGTGLLAAYRGAWS
jgi:hypothetical protein